MQYSKITNLRFYLFTALIILAPLSKYPSFALPVVNFPSFRIGLYQIIAILFIILCLKPLYKQKSFFINKYNKNITTVLLLLSILVATTIAWSNYPQRSALMAVSFLSLIALLFCAWWYVNNNITKKLLNTIINYAIIASIFYCFIGITQFIVGTFFNANIALLCSGCNANIFGFARINGLSAEPQFFANSLIPFFFIAIYKIITKPNILSWASLIATSFTIGLTFSRGAYFALAIGFIVSAIILINKKLISIKIFIKLASVILVSFIFAFSALILGATIKNSNSPNITYETIDSIAEHLTLGLIDLPEKTIVIKTEQIQDNQNTFVSPGLIEASNKERTSAGALAIKAWGYSIFTSLFGVGIGNLGPFVNNYIDNTAPSTLTVYIYYILILAELGLIGLALLLILFTYTMYRLYKAGSTLSLLILGIILSYIVQYLFFGSYINVMYIWLWFGVALGLPTLVSKGNIKHTIKRKNN